MQKVQETRFVQPTSVAVDGSDASGKSGLVAAMVETFADTIQISPGYTQRTAIDYANKLTDFDDRFERLKDVAEHFSLRAQAQKSLGNSSVADRSIFSVVASYSADTGREHLIPDRFRYLPDFVGILEVDLDEIARRVERRKDEGVPTNRFEQPEYVELVNKHLRRLYEQYLAVTTIAFITSEPLQAGETDSTRAKKVTLQTSVQALVSARLAKVSSD